MPKLKKVLGCLGVLMIIIILGEVALWLSGHIEIAIVMIMFIVALISFLSSSAWSALLLRTGAELAIRSQESDDKRDIAQIKAATDLVKVFMGQEEKREREQRQQPKTPLLDQGNWLPDFEFEEGEFEEVRHGSD